MSGCGCGLSGHGGMGHQVARAARTNACRDSARRASGAGEVMTPLQFAAYNEVYTACVEGVSGLGASNAPSWDDAGSISTDMASKIEALFNLAEAVKYNTANCQSLGWRDHMAFGGSGLPLLRWVSGAGAACDDAGLARAAAQYQYFRQLTVDGKIGPATTNAIKTDAHIPVSVVDKGRAVVDDLSKKLGLPADDTTTNTMVLAGAVGLIGFGGYLLWRKYRKSGRKANRRHGR